MTYHPFTEHQQTRLLVSRTRCTLRFQEATRYRLNALDLFTAVFTGAMLGWIAAGAGWL